MSLYPVLIFVLSLILIFTTAFAGEFRRVEWPLWNASEKCQGLTVREEVLLRDASNQYETTDLCNLDKATLHGWIDPYSGEPLSDPKDIDIDHLVPLRWAHGHGAGAWNREKRRAFANDLIYAGHLLAVGASMNRSKGARGPADWKPVGAGKWCAYALRWSAVLVMWDLKPEERERAALRSMLATCKTGGLP